MVDLGRKGLTLSFIARWHRPFIYLYIYILYIGPSHFHPNQMREKPWMITCDEVHDSFYRIFPGGSFILHWIFTLPKTNSKTNPQK